MGLEKIKPCPFCGKDEGEDCYNDDADSIIRCDNCGAIGPPTEFLSDAIEAWNKRYDVKDYTLRLKEAGERGALAAKNLRKALMKNKKGE